MTVDFHHKIDILLEDWPIKLICFVIALLAAVLYRHSLYADATFNVPVDIIRDESMAVMEDRWPQVKVTLRSTKENIAQVTEKDISATVDITRFTQGGIYDVRVRAALNERLESRGPIEVSVSPEHINIALERTKLVYIPIEPLISGEVAHGYEDMGFTVHPDTVLVSGPQSIVEGLGFVNTNKVDIKNATSNVSQTVSLLNINRHIKLEDATQATVTVSVKPVIKTKIFQRMPINFKGIDSNLAITSVVPKMDFELKGPLLNLEALGDAPKIVSVDCSKVKASGKYTLPVTISPPSRLTVSSRSIEKVTVTFTMIKSKPQEQHIPVEKVVPDELIDYPPPSSGSFSSYGDF